MGIWDLVDKVWGRSNQDQWVYDSKRRMEGKQWESFQRGYEGFWKSAPSRPTRDELYIRMAHLIASRTTCPRRAVGCVLVDEDGFILSTGYNGVAADRPHCISEPCPGANESSGQGLDSCEAIHAEQNAILRLRDHRAVNKAYITTSPCVHCIKLLLGTSCQTIFFAKEYPHPQAEDWWVRAGRKWIQL